MPDHMEILSMARELLVDRYEEEKSKAMTQWQMMAELIWNDNGTLLEYPEIPEYPSCSEIMALARELHAYFSDMIVTGNNDVAPVVTLEAEPLANATATNDNPAVEQPAKPA
jgi:hypothetical protein